LSGHRQNFLKERLLSGLFNSSGDGVGSLFNSGDNGVGSSLDSLGSFLGNFLSFLVSTSDSGSHHGYDCDRHKYLLHDIKKLK